MTIIFSYPNGGYYVGSCATSYTIPFNSGNHCIDYYVYHDVNIIFILSIAVQYNYNDQSCNSITYYNVYPLNTCAAGLTPGTSQMYTCSNGAVSIVYYTDSSCTAGATSQQQISNCQGGLKYECYGVPTPTTQSYVIYQAYATTGCTGTATSTTANVQNACVASSGSSDMYSCSNNVPYDNYYSGTTTCTGLSSSSDSLPVTCTR